MKVAFITKKCSTIKLYGKPISCVCVYFATSYIYIYICMYVKKIEDVKWAAAFLFCCCSFGLGAISWEHENEYIWKYWALFFQEPRLWLYEM